MPVKSAKQFRLFEAKAHGDKNIDFGPSPKVAREFLDKTPEGTKSKFAKEKFSKAFRKKK